MKQGISFLDGIMNFLQGRLFLTLATVSRGRHIYFFFHAGHAYGSSTLSNIKVNPILMQSSSSAALSDSASEYSLTFLGTVFDGFLVM